MTRASEFDLQILSGLITQRTNPRSVADDLWPRLIDAALIHSVGPMLFWALRQAGVGTAGNAVWAPLERAAFRQVARHVSLETAQARVNEALRAAGVPALWLKGFSVACTVYPEASLRPIGDVDVLVPYERREQALKIVQSLGYAFHDDPGQFHDWGNELFHELSHHYCLRGDASNPVMLELHFRLLDKKIALTREQQDWFWGQTRALSCGGTELLILRPEAQLLHLIAHVAMQDGEAMTSLMRYLDLHLLIQRWSMDWRLVIDRAVDFRWTYAVERSLDMVARCFDAQAPEWVFSELRSRRPADEDASEVLQEEGIRWRRMAAALRRLSLREGAALALRTVLPPISFMRSRHGADRARFPGSCYLQRWADQAREIHAWARNRSQHGKRNK